MQRHSGTERLFVDEVTIHVRGGKGGDGCVAFHREKFVPKGGPDGGDGGHGGSVYLEAQDGVDTLLDMAGKHHWHAENGRPGEGSNCTGRRGHHLIVPVPTGTLVFDLDSQRLIKDLVRSGERVRVARGGRGGRGNTYYASSTNQTPREAQPGRPGQERTLRLELKLIADAGLVGLPNAGKSTLLSRLTRAKPRIAPYPFTTREPQLGILELPGFRRLVIADLPGLIEGAHQGVGLGHAFLRHVERTRVIVHMIDLCPPDGTPRPHQAYHIIRRELEEYSPTLAQRPEIIVGNKLDLTGADQALTDLAAEIGRPVMGISGVTGQGIRELGEAVWRIVDEARTADRLRPVDRIDFDAPAGGPAMRLIDDPAPHDAPDMPASGDLEPDEDLFDDNDPPQPSD